MATKKYMLLLVGLAALGGCGSPSPIGEASLELTGPEARDRLPAEVAALAGDDVVLCLHSTAEDGDYHRWLVRRPGGGWLEFPRTLRGLDRHETPLSALTSVWRSKLPDVPLGEPREHRCRFTHWRSGPREEIQVREALTDAGWFATVERVRM